MTGYPLNALYEEMAFVGYYLHWPRHELLALEHGERRQWVARDLSDQPPPQRGRGLI